MSLYETSKGFNRQGLSAIRRMVDLGDLTDAIIAPLTTVAGLRAVGHTVAFETSLRSYEQYQHWVDHLEAIGVLTDAAVAAANTADGLIALMTAGDSTLSGTGNMSWVA